MIVVDTELISSVLIVVDFEVGKVTGYCLDDNSSPLKRPSSHTLPVALTGPPASRGHHRCHLHPSGAFLFSPAPPRNALGNASLTLKILTFSTGK